MQSHGASSSSIGTSASSERASGAIRDHQAQSASIGTSASSEPRKLRPKLLPPRKLLSPRARAANEKLLSPPLLKLLPSPPPLKLLPPPPTLKLLPCLARKDAVPPRLNDVSFGSSSKLASLKRSAWNRSTRHALRAASELMWLGSRHRYNAPTRTCMWWGGKRCFLIMATDFPMYFACHLGMSARRCVGRVTRGST